MLTDPANPETFVRTRTPDGMIQVGDIWIRASRIESVAPFSSFGRDDKIRVVTSSGEAHYVTFPVEDRDAVIEDILDQMRRLLG